MPIELDHLFICTSPGGAEAELLTAFGLTEGLPNTHPGQGTACRRFFLANAYLELLWVVSEEEAQSETVRPTHLWERWNDRTSGHCPFGFAFRPTTRHDQSMPFENWEYRPPYLPEPLCIHVASNANLLAEPILFYLPFAKRPDSYPSEKRPVMVHPTGHREMTRIALTGPYANEPSVELKWATNGGFIQLRAGPEYLVELGFDGELQGREKDFRPALPLVLRW